MTHMRSNGIGTAEADAAILEARAGTSTVQEMLSAITAAQVFVPMSAEPRIEWNKIVSWAPATVTKEAASSAFVIAFTDIAVATSFSHANPAYGYGLLVDVLWLLGCLPPNHGLALNIGGPSSFEWSAAGIAAYRSAPRG